MSRVVLFTLGFCNSRILEASWKRLYGTREAWGIGGEKNIEHVFLDNHYPLNREANVARLHSLCSRYNVSWWDSGGDLGLHKSFNKWAFQAKLADDDILVGVDPDFRAPKSPGWLSAIVDVAREPSVSFAALDVPALDRWKSFTGPSSLMREHVTASGTKYWTHIGVEMWTCAAFRWGWLAACGGFAELWEYYGGLEAALFPKWKALKLNLAYVQEHREELGKPWPEELIDKEYVAWKQAHIKGYKDSFAAWLSRAKP